MNNAHPVAYALKGTRMTNDVFGKMLQHVTEKCKENGLTVIATASDGQWHKYGVRDMLNNTPLTLYQLQRDIFKEKMSIPAPVARKYFRNLMKLPFGNLEYVHVERDRNGKLTVTNKLDQQCKMFNCHLKWQSHGNKNSPWIEHSEYEGDKQIQITEIIPTIERFAPGLEIDENLIMDLSSRADTNNYTVGEIYS
ncbi:hypothetical protein DPMN_095370 [Dreissena polymorpha]|uniref:Uncharacterized protein n=1 Tax=Dreissena polymorpha TaxID=45954 RepID=A0A9D4L7R5_DREPO|nr:hypothetical protein DPMN_095370 [Dreissena polymorpha]